VISRSTSLDVDGDAQAIESGTRLVTNIMAVATTQALKKRQFIIVITPSLQNNYP
jgi:hypothetical protein